VYVAMEMLEGQSLRAILGGEPLPVARAIRIARDVARGLAHAHLEGVVHGGIKPSSIIVLRSGAAKIADFGFGQLAQAAGFPRYMSPEQARGRGAGGHPLMPKPPA
jgi:serine/threonine protein kinase